MRLTELSDSAVRSLKPQDAIYRIGDRTLKGLGIVVYPTGKKTFNWKGRVNGVVKTYTLGSHPAHSVDDVRQLAQSILLAKQRGIDAALQDQTLPISPMIHQSRTCDWAFGKYMEQEGGLRKSAAEKWRIYRKEIQPILGAKSIYLIRYDDIAEIVQRKFETAPIMSNNIVSLMKRFFRWSVTKGRHLTKLQVNPISDVVKLASPNERERYLDDYELSMLLSLLCSSSSRMTNPIQFILLTGARRAEAFDARWSEFDLEKGIWTLPSERSKNGDELVLPLSQQAMALIRNRRRFAGNYDFVWPGRNNPDSPMSGYSKSVADLRARMDRIAALDGRLIKPWSLHDLRRTVATGMNGLLDENYRPLIAPEVVERILNHKQTKIRRIYNRWEYFAEKKNALQLWADHLDSLVP